MKTVWSLTVKSVEIQIVVPFSQDLGETVTNRPPNYQPRSLIFSFSSPDLTLRGGRVGQKAKASGPS